MTTAELDTASKSPPRMRIAAPGRWLVALLAFAGVAVLILAAPAEIMPLVLLLLVVSAVVSIGLVWRREKSLAVEITTVLRNWQSLPGAVRGLNVYAIVLMALAAYSMRPRPNSNAIEGFPLFLAGAGFTGLALLLTFYLKPAPVKTREPLYRRVERLREQIVTGKMTLLTLVRRFTQEDTQARPIRWRAVTAGGAMVLMVMQVNALTEYNALSWLRWMVDFSHHLQMLLLVGGSGLVAWGMAGTPPQTPHPPTPSPNGEGEKNASLVTSGRIAMRPYAGVISGYLTEIRAALRDRHVQLFLLVMAIATLTRLWDLELWSTRFLDELHYMNAAYRIWSTPNQQILNPFSQVTAFTWVYPYLQTGTTLLFGPGFTAVRIVSAVFGIAQVAAVYVLGRQVFDRRTGLLAALVLATLPVHVHFSRIGINNIADPLFGILALAFLARGLRSGRQADFALSGWSLGWTQYFYEGGRLFYPLFTVCWLGWLFLFMRRGNYRFPTPRNLLAFGVTAIILILPLYYIIGTRSINLAPRFSEMRDVAQQELLVDEELTLRDRVQPVLNKLQLPLRALVEQPDLSWFYGAQIGFVMPVLVPLFFLGVAHCFWRLRSPGGSLVFWWIIGAATGIALISDSLSAPRYLVMMPAVALALAVGAIKTLALLDVRRVESGEAVDKAKLQRSHRRILALVAVLVTVSQVTFYYGTLVPNFYTEQVYNILRDEKGRPIPDTDDALLRAAVLPPNTDVQILTPNLIWSFNSDTIPLYWNRPDLSIKHRFPQDVTIRFLQNLPRHRNQAFFLAQSDTRTLARIQRYFTLSEDPALNGSLSPYRIPADAQAVLYFAPATQDSARLDEIATPPPVTPIRAEDDVDE